MAEIQSRGGRHAGRITRKRLSTRIDLTPMVDLGFLLITFFLFTTTLARPRVMSFSMPYKDRDHSAPTVWPASLSATILLSGNHRLYYYEGVGDDPAKPPVVRALGYSGGHSIRKAIAGKIAQVRRLQQEGIIRPGQDAAFLIKPDTNSTYEDFVQLLDELNIHDIKCKAVVDITPADQALIARQGRSGFLQRFQQVRQPVEPDLIHRL